MKEVCVCAAMKAPVGLSSGRAVLRASKMEGPCPDKLQFKHSKAPGRFAPAGGCLLFYCLGNALFHTSITLNFGVQPSGSKRSPLASMMPCSVHH